MKTAQEVLKEVAEKRLKELDDLNKRVIARNIQSIERYRKATTGIR